MSQTQSTRRQLRGRDTPKTSSTMSSVRGKSSSGVKMRTRLSTGTLIMNGTYTVKERDVRRSSTSGLDSSAKAQKDAPTTGTKRQAASAEITAVVPPKRRRIIKNDGSQSDMFCWVCHKENCDTACQLCPRSYHLKCLTFQNPPKDWVCGECEKVMQAECLESSSEAMKKISTDKLCFLLSYALDRMRIPGSEVFQKPVDAADLPTYHDVVTYPVDFDLLEKKIKKKEYGCTEAFQSDVLWILHNCVIFNGHYHKLTAVARNVLKSCKHEMAEIEVCPQCYEHSCVVDRSSWFIMPCDPPHPLVWAKLKGYPFWPAKALKVINGCVDVRFFGAHDKSLIQLEHVYKLSKETPVTIKYKKGGFAVAMRELEVHINAIRRKNGAFVYAPIHTPYDRGHTHLKNKSKEMKAKKGLSMASHGRLTIKGKGKEAEKVSAALKRASAVKSKYTTMASKKSTNSTASRQSQTHYHWTNDSSPETAEKAIRRALSDCGKSSISKSLFINPTVSVTDIIQDKNRMQKPIELEEEDEEMEDVKAEDSDELSSEDVTSESEKAKDDSKELSSEDVASGQEAEDSSEEKQMETKETTSETVAQEAINDETKDETLKEISEPKSLESEGSGKEDIYNKVIVKGSHEDDQVVNPEDTTVGEGDDKSEHKNTSVQEKCEADRTDSCTLQKKTGDEIDSLILEDSESNSSVKISSDEESKCDKKFTEKTGELELDCGPSPGLSAKETSVSSDNRNAQKCTDSNGESPVISPPVISPSQKSISTSVSSEISPQSGTQYKASLSKTIEACKDKLGIANVEEIEEPVDVSDDDESLHSKDDEKGIDSGTDNLVESQMSADSQEDSKMSSEMEESLSSCATSKISMKSDSEIVGRKTSLSETDSSSVLGTSELQNNSNSERLERKSQSPAASVSLVQKATNSDLPPVPVTDVAVGTSEKATPVPNSEVACKVQIVILNKTLQDQSNSSANCGVGFVAKECPVTARSPPFTSKCDTANYIASQTRVPASSSDSSNVQAVSVSEKPDAGQGRLVPTPSSQVSVSNSPSDVSEPLPGVSVLKTNTLGTKESVPCAVVTVAEPKCRTENAVNTVSSKISLASSQAPSESSDPRSVVVSKTLTGTTSKVTPITIIDDDDDEPTLLMEVESDIEEPLVIDLVEENSNRNEGKSMSSQKSNSSKFARKLAPSLTIMKNISHVREDSLRRRVQGPVKKKARKTQEISSSPSQLISAWMVPSEPCGMKISDVRSLSGTVHDWREENGRSSPSQPTPPPQQRLQQSQQQPRQQSQQQPPQQSQQQPPQQSKQQPPQQSQQQPPQQSQQQPSQQLQQQPLPQSQQHLPQRPQLQPLQQQQQQPLQKVQEQLQESEQLHSQHQSTATSDSLLSQALQTSKMPPVESPGAISSSSNQRSAPVSNRRSDGNHNNNSSEKPAEQCDQTLSPAAVNLVNKFSRQIMGNTQLHLAELSKELLKTVNNERENEERLNEVKAQMKWMYERQITEIQHTNKLACAEMKACWEAEKSKALSDLKKKMKMEMDEVISKTVNDLKKKFAKEKEEAMAQTKRKQWCANCWKEALYYCCWNTSYCSYTCQQQHWVVHQNDCRQVADSSQEAATTTSDTVATPATISLDKTVYIGVSKDDRSQVQKSSGVPVVGAQGGDLWRNPLAQNIQFIPSQQIRPASIQVQKQPQVSPTQALQQLQYLHSLGTNTPAVIQNSPQVQLMGQRPAAGTILSPRSVIPGHAMVFPILRSTQPGSVPVSQNMVLNQHLHYQPIWKS